MTSSDHPSITTTTIEKVGRVTVRLDLSFAELVRAFEGQLGWWDLEAAQKEIQHGWAVLEPRVSAMAGPHGLMILSKTDQGEIASVAGKPIECTLYLVGNPVTATGILTIDPRASYLVPFRVALYTDAENKGSMLVYDTPSSIMAPLTNSEISAVGVLLDEKMNAIISALHKAAEAAKVAC